MIHLVSSADEAYAPGLLITLASSLASLPHEEHVTFHVLNGGLTQKSISDLEKVSRRCHKNASLIFHDIHAMTFAGWQPGPNNSMMTYSRLLLGSLLPTISKILYLDSDLLVLSNLMELWNKPMNGKIILAARGGANATLHDDSPWELPPEELELPYVNAGVIMMDLDQWRSHSIEKKTIELVNSNITLPFHDQTILNYLLRHDIDLFSMDWNWQGQITTPCQATSIKIIHFITSKKPWFWWSGDPRFQLWRAFYKTHLGSPLQLFARQKSWRGFIYGLFETTMRRFSLLRWCYVQFLKASLARKKNSPSVTALKITYDYYTTGRGGKNGDQEFQESSAIFSTLRRRLWASSKKACCTLNGASKRRS